MRDLVYGLYIYDNVATLDFCGPLEVFAGSILLSGLPGQVLTIAERPQAVACTGGLKVLPSCTFESAPALDVLLVPGAGDLASALGSQAALAWVREAAAQARWVTSVCTGALILQKTGLLAGRRATTHWQLLEDLGRDPSIILVPEARYVRDGKFVTSQGVSAGIDMALWLVGQLHGPEHARQVRKLLQYEPAPPYTAEV